MNKLCGRYENPNVGTIVTDHDNSFGRSLRRLTIAKVVIGQTTNILVAIKYVVHDVIALILAA